MSTALLSQLASLRIGYQFRKTAPYTSSGKYSLIHLRDGSEVLSFGEQEVYRFDSKGIKNEDFVQKGDVLLRSKGNYHFAVLIDREIANAVVSALGLIIRCSDSRILPSFLTWYLNQAPAQSYINKISAGTSLPVVNKGALGELEVPLYPLKAQEAVGELYQLQLTKERLTKELLTKSRKLLNAKLLQSNFSTEVTQ